MKKIITTCISLIFFSQLITSLSYSEEKKKKEDIKVVSEVKKDAKKEETKADKPEKEKYKNPISGFVEIVNYTPIEEELGESEFMLQGVSLAIDVEKDGLGLSADYRFSDIYSDTLGLTHYLEKAEFYYRFNENTKIKIGKIYSPFGLQGDNTWFLSLLYFQGLTLDADWGLGFDMVFPAGKTFDLGIHINYQPMSDGLNGTYYAGLEADSTEGRWGDVGIFSQIRERDTIAGKIDGTYKLNKKDKVNVGVSAQRGRLSSPNVYDFNYMDIAFHLDVNISLIRLLGQYTMVDNNTAGDDNGIGKRKGSNIMAGLSVDVPMKPMKILKGLNIHLNYSQYQRDYSQTTTDPFTGTTTTTTNETTTNLIIGGITLTHNDMFTTTLEYVYGLNDTDISDDYFANHLVLVLSASF